MLTAWHPHCRYAGCSDEDDDERAAKDPTWKSSVRSSTA